MNTTFNDCYLKFLAGYPLEDGELLFLREELIKMSTVMEDKGVIFLIVFNEIKHSLNIITKYCENKKLM